VPGLGPGFWRLWTSSGLSNLADGLVKVALPLVALRVTDSPALIAGVTTAFTVPWLVLALPVGALVDRLDRRRMMLVANAARVVVLASLSVVLTEAEASIWLIYLTAVVAGVAEVVYDTAAQTMVPRVVKRSQLTRANGRLFAAELTANEFVGPPLGGLLVAVGAALAFATPAGLWLLASGALLLVRGSFRPTTDASDTTSAATSGTGIAAGLAFLWRNPVLRTLAALTGVFNLASSACMAILVVYAVGDSSAMGLSESAYGLLLTATAAGSVAGTLVAGSVERRLGSSRAMVAGMALAVLFLAAPAISANAFVVAGCFLAGGVGLVLWNVVAVSLRQRVTPDRMLGRITGAHRLVGWGSKPVGALLGGLLAQEFGLRPVFAVMAVLVLACLPLMRSVSEGSIRAVEEPTP
jgi:MFS family permease